VFVAVQDGAQVLLVPSDSGESTFDTVAVDLDLAQVRRRRRQAPFLKESRLELLAKEMNRLVNEADDE